jgi:hypothetical protein
MVVHACNPSTWEDGKFEDRLGYIVRPCLKKIKNFDTLINRGK